MDGQASGIISENMSEADSNSSDSEFSEEPGSILPFIVSGPEETDIDEHTEKSPLKSENGSISYKTEDFVTWQRIIRLDALRADDEWIEHSPSQATVSTMKARRFAESVGLKDYDNLEPCRIFHAARLVAILEAYALYGLVTARCHGPPFDIS